MSALPLIALTRRSRGMTQADLAQIIQVSIPTVRALERGEGSLRSLGGVMLALGLGWGWVRQGENAATLLAARRREKGLSQAALAQRAGCSRPTIIALERNLSGGVSILLSVLAALGLRRALRTLDIRGKGGLIPATNAPMRDLVMTPAPLAGAIIAHYTDRFDGSILDPARGQGAFFGQFPRHLDRHWCELTDGRDFLRWAEPVDWIMTNPPWSRLRDFTRHAMTLAQNIVWLVPIVNLTTKARLRDLDEHGFGVAELLLIDTPKFWPQSGFQLAAAHLKKGHKGAWQVSRLGLLAE